MRRDITAMEAQMYATLSTAVTLMEIVRKMDPPQGLTVLELEKLYLLLGGARDMFAEDMWVGDCK